MMHNEDIYSKIKLNLAKIEELKNASHFDGTPILFLVGKSESYLELLRQNQVKLLNNECSRKEVDDLVLNVVNFKQNILKQANKKLLQMEYRKDTLSQIYDILLKQNKILGVKDYEVVFNKYKETIDILFVSEDLTSLDSSKTKESLKDLSEKISSLNLNNKESDYKDIFSILSFLINSFSQDINFLKEKIEDLPFLIDEGESSILVNLKNIQKTLPIEVQ